MSWQDYVDNQLIASKCVSKAAIAGHDGSLWAKSAGFEVKFHHISLSIFKIIYLFYYFIFFRIVICTPIFFIGKMACVCRAVHAAPWPTLPKM